MILVIDNYDGCSNNIYQLVGALEPDIRIMKNDQVDVADIEKMAPSHIIVSGGSAAPEKAGNDLKIIKAFAGRIPILGVCLGYRIICSAFGGESVQMDEIEQGKRVLITVREKKSILRGLPDQFYAGYYHSETVPEENIPKEFEVLAYDGKTPAAIVHKTLPIFGVEFHPESFLSECGLDIMRNFLAQ